MLTGTAFVAGFTQVSRLIYPSQCALCNAEIMQNNGLCGGCWAKATWLTHDVCSLCGIPVDGANDGDNTLCEDCHRDNPPWNWGGALLLYEGIGRNLIYKYKLSHHLELAPEFAKIVPRCFQHIVEQQPTIIPVPQHWARTCTRRSNPAARFAWALRGQTGLPLDMNALQRVVRTPQIRAHTAVEREKLLREAFRFTPPIQQSAQTRPLLVVDDVFTSGATLRACTDAIHSVEPDREIYVLAIARQQKCDSSA